MSQYQNSVSFQAPSDFASEQAAVERQRKMAELLLQKSQTPLPGGAMVGNHYVPTSWTQSLAQGLSGPLAQRKLDKADERSKDIASRQRMAYADELGKFAELSNGSPEQKFAAPFPNDDEGNALPAAIKPAVAPDRKAALAQALGAQNPALQQYAMTQMLPKTPEWVLGERFNAQTGQPEKFMYNKLDPNQMQPIGGQQAAKGVAVNGQLVNPATGDAIGQAVPKQADAFNPYKDLVGPNGTPNSPVIAARKDIAKSGASNVSVNTAAKPFLTEIGKGAGEAVMNDFAGAKSAQQTLNNVQQIEQGLKNVIVGPGANARVKLGQIGQVLGVNGKDATEQLQNTRNVMQGLARQELAAAGQMKGQGQITESERGILRRAESGDISELTTPEINTLLGALKKTSQYRIATHNQNLGRLKKDPNAAPVAEYLTLPGQGGSSSGVLDEADAILRAK